MNDAAGHQNQGGQQGSVRSDRRP